MKQQIELSERLRLACLEKGIAEPKFVAQDDDGKWWHYNNTPQRDDVEWFDVDNPRIILYDQPNDNWRQTLMEFITPKIEVGKRYWRRDGEVTGLIRMDSRLDSFGSLHDPLHLWVYTAEGIYAAIPSLHNPMLDLIAEYREDEKPEKISLQDAIKLITESAEENRRIVMESCRKICEND